MVEALRDLVEDRDAARRESDIVHEEHVRSLNNDARQIALALRVSMEDLSQQALQVQELRRSIKLKSMATKRRSRRCVSRLKISSRGMRYNSREGD